MIVLSGLLVVVAIILLILGLVFDSQIGLIYASIGTSVVAGVFLLLGALQRRGEPAAEPASSPSGLTPAADPFERVTAVTLTKPDQDAPVAMPEPELLDEPVAQAAATGGARVSVVPGRPRYHTASCRFLAGRSDVQQLDLGDARNQGYSACGVCRPDESVTAEPAEETAELAAVGAMATQPDAPLVSPFAEPAQDEEPVAEPAKPARKAAATKTAAKKAAAAPAKAATKAAPAKAAPAKAAPAKKSAPAPAKAAPAKATKAAPAKATKAAAKKPAAAASVVVIPDRDKYHTDSCRFVRGVAGTVTVSKATAARQGFEPCGVCKP